MEMPLTNLRKIVSLFSVSVLGLGYANAQDYTFTLKNSLSTERHNETVELEIPENANLTSLALFDEEGNNTPYQISVNNKIVFQANIKAGATTNYYLRAGEKLTPETKTYVVQKMPSTRNDIAWENDISIYRMYSSTLLASEPNTANGVDIWYKKKSYPVIDKMYSYSNYHSEQEEGVDAHSVNGKTLGGGGVAAYANNKLWIHNPHNSCEIIENSPLRSEFLLTYNNVEVDGDFYTKTLRITTYANSLLNKAVVKYEGKEKPMMIAPAIYLHTNMGYTTNGVIYDTESNIIGLAEDKSEGTVTSPNARMFAGIYMSGDVVTETIDHHLVIMKEYIPGTEATFYFGGGWNIFPEGRYTTDQDWFYELMKFKECITHPITETSFTTIPKKSEVIDVIHKANNYWQEANPSHGNAFWNRAAYHTGNMEAFFVTQEQKYLDYSQAWSVQNEWKGAKSDNKASWKYSYGESDDYVLFGDWQICFQVYADLYNLEPEDYKISRAREVMEYQMSTPQNDYWWWADGLYMVMPVMTKLYKITGNELYLEKLHEYWQYANSIMYDEEEGLYYRDAKYTFDKHQTSNGKKDFWARGDGWVFAGLAKVLNDVPEDYKYRDAFLERYQTMARAIANAQMPEGYWSRSLLDPDYAPGYETSGTAFFTYGYLWGINNGYLSEKEYGETVEKAWNYLTTIALQPSGKVGYVQPIGENAAQHNVSAETTADFGVGAFLLAASEMSKFAVGEMPKQVVRLYSASLTDGTKLQALFSKVLKPETATDINNYFIDGTSVEGSISFDGERTVTIELSKPLDYGRYTFSAINLSSVDDEDLEDEAAIMILSPVPSYPLNADYTVTAIGYQTGNPPANSIDNNLNTRWSQEGDNQWIKYDLGQEYDVWGVDLAFYAGDQRISFFEVETSTDNKSFEKVLSDQQSSGKTNDMERYKFPVHKARYIRIVCSGNTANKWNSITEARVCLTDEDPFAELSMPSVISSDILMPAGFFWVSSNQAVLSSTGIATLPETDTSVTLTASSGDKTKDYEVLVKARNPEQNNVVIYYEFLPEDLYKNESNLSYLKDKSGRGNDARVMGKAVIDGSLNLKSNTAAGFSTNGYLLAPAGLIDSLRSYSIVVRVNPEHINNLPRIYDFGSASSNSVFARFDAPSIGFKYNGGATTLINSSVKLETKTSTDLAFTFDAKTKTSRIFINGEMTQESTTIAYEPYQLSLIAANSRNYIGRTQWWDTNVAASNIDYCGTMNEFYLFNTALTRQEIQAINAKETSIKETNPEENMFFLETNLLNKEEKITLLSKQTEITPASLRIFGTGGQIIRSHGKIASSQSIEGISNPGIYFLEIKYAGNRTDILRLIIK